MNILNRSDMLKEEAKAKRKEKRIFFVKNLCAGLCIIPVVYGLMVIGAVLGGGS